MTQEKKLPTIEEWFEENKNENDCAGMTVGFKSCVGSTFDNTINRAIRSCFSGIIYRDDGKGNGFIEVDVILDLVLSKDENGKIVYFIDESKVELV